MKPALADHAQPTPGPPICMTCRRPLEREEDRTRYYLALRQAALRADEEAAHARRQRRDGALVAAALCCCAAVVLALAFVVYRAVPTG